jgi:hypothetical protein
MLAEQRAAIWAMRWIDLNRDDETSPSSSGTSLS